MRRSRDDEGFTIAEVILAMAIFTVVMAVVYQGIISFQTNVATIDARQENLGEARIAINNLSKAIRTAGSPEPGIAPFITAEGLELKYYGYLGSGTSPQQIRFFIDGQNRLVRETIAPTPTSPPTYPTPGTPLVLASFVANDASRPIFTYYDSTGAQMATPVTGNGLLDIQSIQIDIVTSTDRTPRAVPTAIQTRVNLRNVAPPTPTP